MIFLTAKQKAIRDLFARNGGSSHGPRVETLTIPEVDFWRFIDQLLEPYGCKPSDDRLRCKTCDRLLNQPDDPASEDCGGDCLKCMAEAGDPDAQARMAEISP